MPRILRRTNRPATGDRRSRATAALLCPLLCAALALGAVSPSATASADAPGAAAAETQPAAVDPQVGEAVVHLSDAAADLALTTPLGGAGSTPASGADERDDAAETPDWVDPETDRVELLVYFADDGVDEAALGDPELAAAELQRDAEDRWTRIEHRLDAMSDRVSVLNRFWVTDAMLVSAEASPRTLDDLSALPGAIRVAPNFSVSPLDDIAPADAIAPADDAMAAEAVPAEVAPAEALPAAGADESEDEPPVTYGIEKIGADDVWRDFRARGQGVRVAVLDTGVDATHPDIAPRLVGRDSGDPSYPGGWINFDRNGHPVSSKPTDPGSHGTHVAGTILGGAASGTQIGVAPEAELMAANVLSGGGSGAKILAALEWVISPYDAAGRPAGRAADVINMSLGSDDTEFEHDLARAIRNVRDAGIFPAVATGNSGDGSTSAPGSYFDAVGVGMTNADDEVDPRSSGGVISWGAGISARYGWPSSYVKPDLSAPGVGVFSAMPGGRYGESSGTSMATPHVAGAAALVKSAQAGLDVAAIEQALETTAVHPAGAGPDTRYGAGRIDVHEAVAAVRGSSMINGTVVDDATSRPISGATVSYGERGETWVTDAKGRFTAWLPQGAYTLSVARFGYEAGSASATVPATGAAQLAIRLAPITTGSIAGTVVSAGDGSPVAGATVQVLGQDLTAVTDAAGAYRFDALPVGEYRLRASFAGKSDATSAAAPVKAALETQVRFTLADLTRVLVLGDNGGRTAALLNDNGFSATPSDALPAAGDLASYDAVLWDAPAGAPTAAQMRSIIAATDASGTGVIWLDLGDSASHGIGALASLTGDPAGRAALDDRSAAAVGYEVTAPHDIFAGGALSPEPLAVGDVIVQNSAPNGPKPAAWFTSLTGNAPTVLAEAVAQRAADPGDPRSVVTERLGTGIAVDQRAKNRHVFLSLHGSYAAVDARNWSIAGAQLLLNSVTWAAPAAAQTPEPEIVVPTAPEIPKPTPPTPPKPSPAPPKTPAPKPHGDGTTGTATTGAPAVPVAAPQAAPSAGTNRAPSSQAAAKPKTRPEPPVRSAAELTTGNAEGVTVRVEDGIAYVSIPGSEPGDWFFLHVYPSKTAVDWIRVNDDGELRIDVSRLQGGTYQFAFTDVDGEFAGWATVKIPGSARSTASAGDPAEAPTVVDIDDPDASPGAAGFSLSTSEQLILLGSALLILAAAGVLFFGPRRRRAEAPGRSAEAPGRSA